VYLPFGFQATDLTPPYLGSPYISFSPVAGSPAGRKALPFFFGPFPLVFFFLAGRDFVLRHRPMCRALWFTFPTVFPFFSLPQRRGPCSEIRASFLRRAVVGWFFRASTLVGFPPNFFPLDEEGPLMHQHHGALHVRRAVLLTFSSLSKWPRSFLPGGSWVLFVLPLKVAVLLFLGEGRSFWPWTDGLSFQGKTCRLFLAGPCDTFFLSLFPRLVTFLVIALLFFLGDTHGRLFQHSFFASGHHSISRSGLLWCRPNLFSFPLRTPTQGQFSALSFFSAGWLRGFLKVLPRPAGFSIHNLPLPLEKALPFFSVGKKFSFPINGAFFPFFF